MKLSIIFKVHFTLNLFIKSLIGNYKYVVLLHIHLWLMKSIFLHKLNLTNGVYSANTVLMLCWLLEVNNIESVLDA